MPFIMQFAVPQQADAPHTGTERNPARKTTHRTTAVQRARPGRQIRRGRLGTSNT